MPGRKRKQLSEADAAVLDSTSFIGEGGPIDKVLDEEIPPAAAAAAPAPAAEPAAAAAAEPVASSTTMKWQKVLEKHQEENPQIKWTEPELAAHRAHLANEQSKRGDAEMHRIGKANLKNVKKWYENSGVGGTKKKNKKNNKKNNKTKKGGKQTRRGGKKTRRRRNKTLKRKLSK